MTEQGGEKIAMRRVDVRMTTADQDLLKALESYVQHAGKPKSQAIEALKAVKKSLGLPPTP